MTDTEHSTAHGGNPRPAVIGIDHVQLAMPHDEEVLARAFYGDVLGLEEDAKPQALAARGGVWFRCGAQMLHLGVEADFRPARKAHPALLVRDLAPVRSRLVAAGFPVIEDDALPGYERFYTADPFGNRIEILRPLAAFGEPAEAAVKSRVRATYTAAAEAYVTSPTHASGPDLEQLVNLVAPQPGEHALDLSTGGGHVALALARAGAVVTAVDLTPAMLAAARTHLREAGIDDVTYVVGDAEQLPFLDGTFDLVTVRIAPHHYADVRAAMAEVARVLVPGGRLGLIDNIVPEDGALARLMNEWEQRRDPSHVRALPRSEWDALLAEVGLRITALEVGRKRHTFAPWAERTGMDPTARQALARDMLAANDAARKAFSVEGFDEEVLAWSCDYVIVRAEKPELDRRTVR